MPRLLPEGDRGLCRLSKAQHWRLLLCTGNEPKKLYADLSHSLPVVSNTKREYLLALKQVIDATGLFPSDLLDSMLEGFFSPGGDGSVWLTFEETEVEGVVYCVPEHLAEDSWNMLLLAVHPQSQNRGRGTELVRSLESLLRGKSARLLIVETSGTSAFSGARSSYCKIGFQETGRIPDFYGEGDDKIILYKRL